MGLENQSYSEACFGTGFGPPCCMALKRGLGHHPESLANIEQFDESGEHISNHNHERQPDHE
jgi:hypothetical protein